MKYVKKPIAVAVTSALVFGGIVATAGAAQAVEQGVEHMTLDDIQRPVEGGQSAVYNSWHFDPSHKPYPDTKPVVKGLAHGIFISGMSNVNIIKGNGNDAVADVSDLVDATPLGQLLDSMAIESTSTQGLTFQVPVRWDVDGDGDWEADTDGWSTLRAAPAGSGVAGAVEWTSSKAITKVDGETGTLTTLLKKDGKASPADFQAWGVYPIASGFLVQKNTADVRVSGFAAGGITTRFDFPLGTADAWSGSEDILAADIDGAPESAENYTRWHLGTGTSKQIRNIAGEGFNEVAGLAMTGKTQVLLGFLGEGELPNAARLGTEAEVSGVTGEVFFQIPVYAYLPGSVDRVYTTIHAQVPESGKMADAQSWRVSRSLAGLTAIKDYPLDQILDAIGDHHVSGYGVFVDANQQGTVSSVTFNGKTTNFTRAASAPEATQPLSLAGIAHPTTKAEETEHYNAWHFDPDFQAGENVSDARNGLLVKGGSKVLLVAGNGNDQAASLKNLPDSTKLSTVLNELDAQVSDATALTLQVPVRWDSNGDDEWSPGEGWSTLRKAPGATQWTSSQAIDFGGLELAKGAATDASAFEAAGIYPIAAGAMIYNNSSDVLLSSVTTHRGVQGFGKSGGAAAAWNGSENVLAAGIEGAETEETLTLWHLGDGVSANLSDVAGVGLNEVTGLKVTGKTQVLRYLEESEILPNAADLASDMTIALVDGEAWAQIPVYSYQPGVVEPIFTTLRAQVPASGKLAEADKWYTSQVVGSLKKSTTHTLTQILDGIGEHDVIGYGVFVDTDKTGTVSSITFNGKTTSFTRAAEKPIVPEDKEPVVSAALGTTTQVSVKSAKYNASTTATISVTAKGKTPTGKVTGKIAGHAFSANLKNGKATVTFAKRVNVGTHSVTATYASNYPKSFKNSSYSAKSFKVVKASPKVTASLAKSSVKSKQNATVKVSVSVPGSLKAQASKATVKVYDGKKLIKSAKTGSTGKVNVKLPKLKKGTHKIWVQLSSATNWNSAKSSSKVLKVK